LESFSDGDIYKLIWEEELVDGKPIRVKSLKGVYLNGKELEKPIYALYYNNGKAKGWFGPDSLPEDRDGFLLHPLHKSRISSHYNLLRPHPILGEKRPHYGTDYAAPLGSPIMSVADGVVEIAGYGRRNGKFVKIRHRPPYQSQYLHMNGFAEGIRPGAAVKKGQVIGFVGETGLATGPHVCFRLWKNGEQVNHLCENLPKNNTFSDDEREAYRRYSKKLVDRLDNITLQNHQAGFLGK
jgi:murein DD-endopeptidase MepM/ murein hydrolase activator NlpD